MRLPFPCRTKRFSLFNGIRMASFRISLLHFSAMVSDFSDSKIGAAHAVQSDSVQYRNYILFYRIDVKRKWLPDSVISAKLLCMQKPLSRQMIAI